MSQPENKPTTAQPNISSNTEQALLEQIQAHAIRIEALEEFFAHFVTVLECESRRGFTSERMNAWLNMCTMRMGTTQSASDQQIKALRRLQKIVLQ